MTEDINDGTEKTAKVRNHFEYFLFVLLGVLIIYLFIQLFYPTGFSITGGVVSENQENQTVNIRFAIELKDAEHFSSDYSSNIYNEMKEIDGIWSEQIYDGDFIRITFEENLISKDSIMIYPKVILGNPVIGVYEKDGTELIAEFRNLNSEEYNRIFLVNLKNPQDTFDLRVVNGSVEFEHIAG